VLIFKYAKGGWQVPKPRKAEEKPKTGDFAKLFGLRLA
jgi:hypothetical protein